MMTETRQRGGEVVKVDVGVCYGGVRQLPMSGRGRTRLWGRRLIALVLSWEINVRGGVVY